MEKSSILVTGGTGFVGSNLIEVLTSHGYIVSSLSRRKSEKPEEKVKYLTVESLDSIKDWSPFTRGVDTIVHCAARVHVLNETSKDPLREFYKVNRDATIKFARNAASEGVKRFIFISTIGVLGAESNEAPFGSDTAVNPHSPYAVSKLEAEQGLLKIAEETGLEVVIIRPPLIYGPEAPGNFAVLLKFLKKGIPLPFGDKTNRRSFLAIDNLIDLILHCIEMPHVVKEPIAVSDAEVVSTGELISRIGRAWGTRIRLLWFPLGVLRFTLEVLGKKGMAQQLCGSLEIDVSQVQTKIGWVPKVSMDEALKRIAQSESNN